MKRLQRTTRLAALPLAIVGALLSWLWLQTGTSAGGLPPGLVQNTTQTTPILVGYPCAENEWLFYAKSFASQGAAPATLTVRWTAGEPEKVPLTAFSNGVAQFSTTSHLNDAVVRITADVNDSVQAVTGIAHGPCVNPPEVAGLQVTGIQNEQPLGSEVNERIPFVPAGATYPALAAFSFGAAHVLRRSYAKMQLKRQEAAGSGDGDGHGSTAGGIE